MHIIYRYEFWLIAASLICLSLERIAPWRKQKFSRPEIWQDFFWLFFNGVAAAWVFGPFYHVVFPAIDRGVLEVTGVDLSSIAMIDNMPLYYQVPLLLITADFIEWLVHNLLHRFGPLWKLHRVHHSIKTMDWIGNFRFHWSEILVYNFFKYIPLALLGASWQAILIVAVISTFIGHLNHSNLNLSYGPLRYIINSPKMHIWHHEKQLRGKAGTNFAVVFSAWDWLFGTAYMPMDHQPEEIGFDDEETLPKNLYWRFFIPFINHK